MSYLHQGLDVLTLCQKRECVCELRVPRGIRNIKVVEHDGKLRPSSPPLNLAIKQFWAQNANEDREDAPATGAYLAMMQAADATKRPERKIVIPDHRFFFKAAWPVCGARLFAAGPLNPVTAFRSLSLLAGERQNQSDLFLPRALRVIVCSRSFLSSQKRIGLSACPSCLRLAIRFSFATRRCAQTASSTPAFRSRAFTHRSQIVESLSGAVVPANCQKYGARLCRCEPAHAQVVLGL